MKKILLFLGILLPLVAQAQLNGDGYYRIQNNASERYLTLKDNVITGKYDLSSFTADISNLRTWRGFDLAEGNPATIFYIEKVGTQYNMSTQGTSIYEISGGSKYLDIYERGNGAYYLLSLTAKGVTANLFDSSDSDVRGYLDIRGDNAYKFWKILPVNTDDNYIGLKPTIKTNDGWYGTIYADFPFKVVSSGISIFYVDGVAEGMFRLKEITDEIKPGGTPLLFKCSSDVVANNKIMPIKSDFIKPTDNLMGGTYFASSNRNHIARVEYDATTMRVLGVDKNNNLIFTTATANVLTDDKYIPMNTCWLNVAANTTSDLKFVDRDNFPGTGIYSIEANPQSPAAKGTYTLTGIRVENSTTLRPGIYIQNGKKVVIK